MQAIITIITQYNASYHYNYLEETNTCRFISIVFVSHFLTLVSPVNFTKYLQLFNTTIQAIIMIIQKKRSFPLIVFIANFFTPV